MEREVYGREEVPLLTAAEAAAWDREARERHGVPERVLMENAGRSAALVLARLFPEGRVVAAVGGGNNGGDALVALRTLAAWGREVAYVVAGSRSPDAALAHGRPVAELSREEAERAFAHAGVLVDGLLGTGASGAPRGDVAWCIEAMNRSGRPIVALDLPSGIDPTTGAVPGVAVQAAVTVTFGAPKQGLLFHPGRERCGRIVAVEIAFPPELPEGAPAGQLITPGWAAARLPARPATAHKGTAGWLLVVAGRKGMAGAAALSARGAIRAGAGLVMVASAADNRVILQSANPEALFVEREDAAALAAAVGRVEALVVGPAIGVGAAEAELLDRLLDAAAGKPVLLDADAITLMAESPERLRRAVARGPVVLTPHPGEMARLTGRTVADITAAPLATARDLANETGCVVLLKGQPSVVAAPGESVLINSVGSSDVAAAGMGDQLAGTIGAFLAAGAPARSAAALGLFYSGRAADIAARGRSLSPMDVAAHLHRAMADPGPAASALELPFVTFDQPPRW